MMIPEAVGLGPEAKTVQKLTEKGIKALENVGEKEIAKEAEKVGEEESKTLTQKAKDKAKNAVSAVNDATNKAVDKVVDVTKKGVDAAKNTADQVANHLGGGGYQYAADGVAGDASRAVREGENAAKETTVVESRKAGGNNKNKGKNNSGGGGKKNKSSGGSRQEEPTSSKGESKARDYRPIPKKVTVKMKDGSICDIESNNKHTRGRPGYDPNSGTEPKDSLEIFRNSIPDPKSPKGVRYGVDSNGNIHRFGITNSTQGLYHWNGSTGDPVRPLTKEELPKHMKGDLKEMQKQAINGGEE